MTLLQEPDLVAEEPRSAPARGARAKLILIRAGLVVAGLAAWFLTQSLLGSRHAPAGALPVQSDGLLSLLAPVHDYLWTHAGASDALLISSSALIDALGVFMLGSAIFGRSIRPFLGLLILFGLRQIFQTLCVLPLPEQMIWRHPGFPSLLVTYGVSNDLFFSGHTAMAVFGAVELARLRKSLVPAGIAIALFEILAVLALRAHWTMDVYAGAITALLVAAFVTRIARPCDRAIGRVAGLHTH